MSIEKDNIEDAKTVAMASYKHLRQEDKRKSSNNVEKDIQEKVRDSYTHMQRTGVFENSNEEPFSFFLDVLRENCRPTLRTSKNSISKLVTSKGYNENKTWCMLVLCNDGHVQVEDLVDEKVSSLSYCTGIVYITGKFCGGGLEVDDAGTLLEETDRINKYPRLYRNLYSNSEIIIDTQLIQKEFAAISADYYYIDIRCLPSNYSESVSNVPNGNDVLERRIKRIIPESQRMLYNENDIIALLEVICEKDEELRKRECWSIDHIPSLNVYVDENNK